MANSASSNELHSITKHNNIVISGVQANEVLKFDGSNWINQTLVEAGIAPVATPTFTTSITIGSASLTEAELEMLDGITAGTAAASKAVVLDSSTNITGIGTISSGAITSTGGITGTQVDITAQGDLRLQDSSGGQYVALQAAGTTTTHTLTLPAAQGGSSTFLQNDGSGALSWAAAGGTTINNNANNRVITGSGTANTLEGEASLTYDGNALAHSVSNSGGNASFTLEQLSTNSGSDARMFIRIPEAATEDAMLFFYQGNGNGDTDHMGYYFDYKGSGSNFTFHTADAGSSADAVVWSVTDGSSNLDLNNNSIINVEKIGIGTSVPQSLFEVASTSSFQLYASLFATSGEPRIGLRHSQSTSINGHSATQSGDNLGAITFSGSTGSEWESGVQIAALAQQNWTGQARRTNLIFYTADQGNHPVTFTMAYDGDITGTHGTYHDGSDERLKKEIITIPDALAKVIALRGVNFKWRDEEKGTKLRMGLVAQEVESIVPELIHTQEDVYTNEDGEEEGGLKAVEYQYMTGLLVEAIKELKAEVDALKA